MIILGNCLDKLKELDDNSVDSIVTDPPYELGFMGKKWDNTGIAYNTEMWKECLRVLKPGGHILAFSGTRTYHRMAVAIEDAGFEIRDMVEWVYGSGFPKSMNIGKAVDKIQGNEREDLGLHPHPGTAGKTHTRDGGAFKDDIHITKGTSPWEGWGTALKPAHEPICLARKPISEKTIADNVLKWGTGGLNIDKSRVGTETRINNANGATAGGSRIQQLKPGVGGGEVTGRFPANLLHDGSNEVVREFPNTKATKKHGGDGGKLDTRNQGWGFTRQPSKIEDNGGSAARFFKSFVYIPKASKSERDRGCENMEYKQKIFNGQSAESSKNMKGVEQKFTTQPSKNNHPTVKPIALMKYLIQMITPPGGTVLDPFAGSGSTLVAAKELGYDFIGIEMTEEYIPIIEARLDGAIIKNNDIEYKQETLL